MAKPTINTEFSKHAYNVRAVADEIIDSIHSLGFGDLSDGNADNILFKAKIATYAALAINADLCTSDEIIALALRPDDRNNIEKTGQVLLSIDNNPNCVIEFLAGRANRAIRIANQVERYNPSPKDGLPNGFMGWRKFVVA